MATVPRTILMMAYHFPPIQDSGSSRPLAFARYLTGFGYRPVVLAGTPAEGAALDVTRLADVPAGVVVERAAGHQPQASWALRARPFLQRLKSVDGALGRRWVKRARYPLWRLNQYIQQSEREGVWAWPAERLGAAMVRRHRPALIWATGPPFDTMVAGARLSARTGLPLVVDYRDPWTYGILFNPATEALAAAACRRERDVLAQASRVVFTSPLTEQKMAGRYPEHASRFTTILNGFEDPPPITQRSQHRDHLLVRHIGVVPSFRTPHALLDALDELRRERPRLTSRLSIEFVGRCEDLARLVCARGLDDIVRAVPPVTYDESRRLMADADVLMLIQSVRDDSSDVISGKVYDYLCTGRPILAIVPPEGGDAWLLRSMGMDDIVAPDRPAELAERLARFIECRLEGRTLPGGASAAPHRFHRQGLTSELARVFDDVL